MTPHRQESSHAPYPGAGGAFYCSHAVKPRENYDARFRMVSNGLNAARVAAAASTLLAGDDLIEQDRSAVEEVVQDLRVEALALRNPKEVGYGSEGSFAFAGLALKSYPRQMAAPRGDAEYYARALDELADELESMLGDAVPPPEELEVVKQAFLDVSRSVGRELARTGELADVID
jgi:hypothetical protein